MPVDGWKTASTVGLSTPAYWAWTGTSAVEPKATFDAVRPVGSAKYQVAVDGRNTPMCAKPSPVVVTAGRSPDTPYVNVVGYPSSIAQLPEWYVTRVLFCRNWKSCGVRSWRAVASCSPG